MKENKKMNKYLDLAVELKKQCNMNMRVILITVGMPGTVPKGLEKRLVTWEDFLSLRLKWERKATSWNWCEKLAIIIIIIMITLKIWLLNTTTEPVIVGAQGVIKKGTDKWCNGYGRRKWIRRYEFKSWTRLIAFHIALIPLGKVWIQLFSLQLWVNSRAD